MFVKDKILELMDHWCYVIGKIVIKKETYIQGKEKW